MYSARRVYKLGKLMRKKKEKLSIDDIIHFDALKQRSVFLYIYRKSTYTLTHAYRFMYIYSNL